MSKPVIAIVTANSNSGTGAVEDLVLKHAGKVHVRAIFRTEAKAQSFQDKYGDQADFSIVTGVDAHNKDSLKPAFEGATMALIVTPHDPTQGFSKDHELSNTMIAAAVEAEVQYIVYVGSWTVHAPNDVKIISSRFVPTEAYLEELAAAGKVAFTSLRSGFFNPNFIQLFGQAKTTDKVAFPDLTIPVVDPRDMGRVAAALFVAEDQTKHHGQYYDISGPDKLKISELVTKVAEARGKAIEFQPIPVDALTFLPEYLQQAFQYMAKVGEDAVPHSTITAELTGKQTSFDEWLEENKAAFAPEA
eukprot:TRINITY_DN2973_c0_g1_i1.p1 TRINITY_DN2973_c0_g1~~TRINITY_DN2973_c0_g1_i1.p1  ORF type:complete len:303 (+),score=88.30 TRINITY_DN2973_c0_g1_i1:122-1030(+)